MFSVVVLDILKTHKISLFSVEIVYEAILEEFEERSFSFPLEKRSGFWFLKFKSALFRAKGEVFSFCWVSFKFQLNFPLKRKSP